MRVQSLVGELRSHMLSGMAKRNMYIFYVLACVGHTAIILYLLFFLIEVSSVLVAQSYLTLCDPVEYGLPKSPLSMEFSRHE